MPPGAQQAEAPTSSSIFAHPSRSVRVFFGDNLSSLATRGLSPFLSTALSFYRYFFPKPSYPPLPRAGPDLAIPRDLISLFQEKPGEVKEKLRELLDTDEQAALSILINLSEGEIENPVFLELLIEAFGHAPSVVITGLSSLFFDDRSLGEKWILHIAKCHQTNPNIFVAYRRKNNQSRVELIGACDKIFKDFFLTKELRDFRKRVDHSDFNSGEASAMYGNTEGLDSSALVVGAQYQSLKAIDQKVVEFWSGCVAFIMEQSTPFSGLNLTCKEEHIHREETSSFGDFCERLLFVEMEEDGRTIPAFNPVNLLSTPIFNDWMKLLGGFTEYIQAQTKGDSSEKVLDEFPRLGIFFQKIERLLASKDQGDQSHYEAFRRLVTKIVDVYYPSGKSPKK